MSARVGYLARMAVIAFDLNGTLLDPTALVAPLEGVAPQVALDALDDAVAQAMARSLAGVPYGPFGDLLGAALRRQLELAGHDPAGAEAALGQVTRMPAYPEAAGALELLAGAGHRLAVVSNSGAEVADEGLRHAGLRSRMQWVIGSDGARAYKPDPRVYAHAVERFGAAPDECWLVAAHWWDVLGAAQAGWNTAWVGRKERVLLDTVEPDVTGGDLREAAELLAAWQ